VTRGVRGGSGGLGGAIYCKSGTASIAASEVRNNSATGGIISRDGIGYRPGPAFGGAIYTEKGTISIIETFFLKNEAKGGGYPPPIRTIGLTLLVLHKVGRLILATLLLQFPCADSSLTILRPPSTDPGLKAVVSHRVALFSRPELWM
jgi:hypothetical protein